MSKRKLGAWPSRRCRRRARRPSAGRGDPRRRLHPVRRARLSGGDGARHHEGLRADAGRALQPLQVQGRAAARHHRLDPGRARAASASRRWRGRATIRAPSWRPSCAPMSCATAGCGSRRWSPTARSAGSTPSGSSDIRRSRRAIRDIVVGILSEGIERGVFDPPAGRRQARPQGDGDGAARPVDARLHVVRCRAAGSARSRWPRLYADMALARRGRQAAVSDRERSNGWQMIGSAFRALLVVLAFWSPAARLIQAAAPPPVGAHVAADRDAVGRRQRAGRSLARGADRRRQQQPGLRQRRRRPARTLRGDAACATSAR